MKVNESSKEIWGFFSGVLMVKEEFNQGDTFLIQHMYV